MKKNGKKIIRVLLAVMIIASVLSVASLTASATGETKYKMLYWSAETTYAVYSDVVEKAFSEMDGVTVVTKTSGPLTADELSDVQLVYIVNFSVASTSAEGKNMIDAAPLLKDFVIKGGRVIMNGEWNGFAAIGNATLSELAAAMGGNFTILDDYSVEQDMIFNTEQKPELTKNLTSAFRPNAFAPIESTNSDAVWVAKDKSGMVFVLDQKVEKGYITVISDINWIYDGENDADMKAQAACFLGDMVVDSVQNMEAVEEETATKHTIKLNKQNGKGGTDDLVLKQGEVLPDITVPTREGYTFGGYYSQADGKGVKYYNADGTGAAVYSANGDITLYALWTENKPTSPKTGDNNITFVFALFSLAGVCAVTSRKKVRKQSDK